jgi:hypothetical protein
MRQSIAVEDMKIGAGMTLGEVLAGRLRCRAV